MENEVLKRPSLKQFVSTKATPNDINSMFLNNTELYNYITALDAYCDELESRLCAGKPDSDTSGGLYLACISNCKPPLWLDDNNAYLIGKIYKNAKTDDDGYKLKAVQFLQKIAKKYGYEIQIMEAIQLIEAYCCKR